MVKETSMQWPLLEATNGQASWDILDKIDFENLPLPDLLALILHLPKHDSLIIQLAQQITTNVKSIAYGIPEDENLPHLLTLKAILELGNRLTDFHIPPNYKIVTSHNIAQILIPKMRFLPQEYFYIIALNEHDEYLGMSVLYKGTINFSPVRVCEIFREGMKFEASALILAHNHPSGLPTPSPEDILCTKQAIKAGHILGVEVIDHIIIGDKEYVSLKDDRYI